MQSISTDEKQNKKFLPRKFRLIKALRFKFDMYNFQPSSTCSKKQTNGTMISLAACLPVQEILQETAPIIFSKWIINRGQACELEKTARTLNPAKPILIREELLQLVLNGL